MFQLDIPRLTRLRPVRLALLDVNSLYRESNHFVFNHMGPCDSAFNLGNQRLSLKGLYCPPTWSALYSSELFSRRTAHKH